MQKTDIFGKKPYKNTPVKSVKPMLKYCYLLAIRTDADISNFFKLIYTQTNYLFYLSQERFQMEELDKSAAFQSFIHKDVISDYKVFYLQNTGFESDKCILGYGNNALFQLKKLKKRQRKQKSQISLYFERDADTDMEIESNEIKSWYNLKSDLTKHSMNIMDKINYLFPIRIETYEIIKPLLLHLPKIQSINYMLIEPEQINNAVPLFMHFDLITERINSIDKEPSLLKRVSDDG